MNRNDIAHAVSTTLGDHIDDYDIDAIVQEIVDTHGLVSIDDIDTDEYWALIERHDTTGTKDEDGEAATITADHVHALADARFGDMAVLALDTDGAIEVFPASTATERGARVLYDADRLEDYTGGELDDELAARLAADLTAELRR